MPLVCVCPRLVHPNVGRNPFRVHLVPLATKHHIPPHNAYSLRGACALSCLVCCDVKNKTLAKSLRSGAEHTTSGSTPPPHRPRQATRSLRRRSTSPHPSRRGGCIACPSSACASSPCPPTDPSPADIQHCLSVPASAVLPGARTPPTARLCLPVVRHRVCARGPCVHPTRAPPRRPPCHYPKLAPLAPASLRVCPLPYGRRAQTKTQTRVHEHVGSLVVVAVGVKERR